MDLQADAEPFALGSKIGQGLAAPAQLCAMVPDLSLMQTRLDLQGPRAFVPVHYCAAVSAATILPNRSASVAALRSMSAMNSSDRPAG